MEWNRRVALASALFPSRDEGATGPSLLGTGDDSVPQFVAGGRVAQIPSVQEVGAPGLDFPTWEMIQVNCRQQHIA